MSCKLRKKRQDLWGNTGNLHLTPVLSRSQRLNRRQARIEDLGPHTLEFHRE
jgi:hypothetical protein